VVKFLNPLPFELQVNDMRLLTDGIVFESIPESVVLQSNACAAVSLYGSPLEVGEMEINGYSTHTLGVKSNCRLKHMLDRSFPVNYRVNVVSALPLIELKTSLLLPPPQSTSDSVICTAKASLFNGETQECAVTVTNSSNIEIDYFEMDLQSSLDTKTQKRMFEFDREEVKRNLPLAPGKSFDIHLKIYADADFIGSMGTAAMSSLSPHPTNEGPPSLMSGIGNSMPSRVSSPIRRNNDQNSSFRSTSTNAGTVNSGHSSLATFSLGAMINAGNQTRSLDVQLKFRYSGGNGHVEGYCRECSLALNLELMPSIQVTSWDVLPAEV
jgi:hypothetical protein